MTTIDADINKDMLDEKEFHSIKSALYNSKGISYIEFKKTLKPSYISVWISIALGWLFLASILLAGSFAITFFQSSLLKIFFVIADAMFIGFFATYLINFFHEAAHYNIARDKNSNDLLANIFIGIFQAQGIKHYRIIHWQHHIQLGTTEDTERSYFEALSARFFFESLTGIKALRIFLFRSNKVSGKKDPAIKREARIMFFTGLLFHLIVLSLFILTKKYWLIPVWILGFGAFFPFFNSLRQLLEHRSEAANKKADYRLITHGKLTRIFNNGPFALVCGSAGFNRHLLHHLEPQVSYTNLHQIDLFLQDTILAPQLNKQRTSYLKVFIALFGK